MVRRSKIAAKPARAPPPGRILPLMPDRRNAASSRTLVFIILGIIVVSIVAFIVLHPRPNGNVPTSSPSSPTNSQH